MGKQIINTRAGKAGISLAKSIIAMVHLMYQDNTAFNFFKSLINRLKQEFKRRLGHKKCRDCIVGATKRIVRESTVKEMEEDGVTEFGGYYESGEFKFKYCPMCGEEIDWVNR